MPPPDPNNDPLASIRTPWGPLTPTGGGGPGGSGVESPPIEVPDHVLLRRIGRGAYGEVWLARNALGIHRAVKILDRAAFEDDRPFEREFAGIQRFEPVSRSHESQLNILHVGRGADHFYYVMELADDQGRGAAIEEATYVPRSLRSELLFRGRIPVDECLRLGLALATALTHLHRHGLVHRDIKPSNIVFVNGIPKLADIGLVALAERTMSFVGTEGYLPPEGPGTVQADLFSLGKVLYEISTGNDRQQFPDLPTRLSELPDRHALAEFNEVLVRACAPDPRQRYRTAAEMHADLALLQSGGSVARQRRLAGQLRFVQRVGALVTVLAALGTAGWWWQSRQTAAVRTLAAENLLLARQSEANAAAARQSEATARERLYAADMNLAQQALESENLRLARSLLEHHRPRPGEPDLRGFEWRYLWQRCRGDQEFAFPAQTNAARVLAFAPDGRHVAVGVYTGGGVRLLDLDRRSEVARFANTNEVFSLSFAPNGKWLARGSGVDVVVLEAQALAESRRLTHATAPALFSPDGRYLLTGGTPRPREAARWEDPQELVVWDTRTWTPVHRRSLPASGSFSGSRDLYLQLAFGAGSDQVATLAGDTVRVLSCPGLEDRLVVPEKLPTSRTSRPFLAWSPDQCYLAFPSPQGFGVRLWDVVENRERAVLQGHADHVFSVSFSPDGGRLLTASPDQTIKQWQVPGGELLRTFRGQADEVVDVAFAPDGRRFASLGITESVVMLWDPDAPERLEAIRRPLIPTGFDAAGNLVGYLVGSLETVALDPASQTLSWTPGPRAAEDVSYGIYLRSLSSDGRLQAAWRFDERTLEVWDRVAEQRLCMVPALAPLVSFDLDRQWFSTFVTNGAGDSFTAVWELPEGRLHLQVPGGGNPGMGLVSAQGDALVLAEDEIQFRVWQLASDDSSPRAFLELPGEAGATISPDGRVLATATGDIHLRSLPSGEPIGVLKGHTRKTVVLSFTPDGRTLGSVADDRTVRLWHVATQREMLRFSTAREDHGPFMPEFSPDGRALAVQRRQEDGSITWLHYAPALAEIAVEEGDDYRTLAGTDAATWRAVAGGLQRRGRFLEALEACDRALECLGTRPDAALLRPGLRQQRAEVLRALGRLDEAGVENLTRLRIPARDTNAPATTLDLSAFYTAGFDWRTAGDPAPSDLQKVPMGVQTLNGTVFDLRGVVTVGGASTNRWEVQPERERTGIPVRRQVVRLHFLHAEGGRDPDLRTGDRIARYVVHYGDGQAVEVPVRFNVDTSDWWAHDDLPKELPEASVAWSGSTVRGRHSVAQPIRLFKRTWSNPHPDREVVSLDVVGERAKVVNMLVAVSVE